MKLAIATAVLACLTASDLQARPVQLTAEQMRLFGVAAIAHGAADQALGIAGALLQRDANDSAAMSLQAQGLREKGDLAASETAARAAWAAADSDANRFAAATALAQTLSLQGHRTSAQYWLRQAVQNAPTAEARAQAIADFAYVRSQNPLHLQVDTSVRPSNNVNNGSRETLLGYLFGTIPLHLPPEYTPLSGVSLGFGLSGDYRLGATSQSQDSVLFALNAEGAVLSEEAKRIAPAADAANYAFQQIEAGWRHKQALSFGILTTELTAGHNWYGGADLSNILSAQALLDHPFSERSALSLTSSLTQTQRLDRPVSSATGLAIQTDYRFLSAKGQIWQTGFGLWRNISDDTGIDSLSQQIDLNWQAARPVFGLGLAASAAVLATDFSNERHDTRLTINLSAWVAEISYLGFSPVVSLDYSRNNSNFSYQNTETIGIGLRLRSNF
jgi:hypothetical protein